MQSFWCGYDCQTCLESLTMFEAKLLKNLTSIGILATFVSNISHKLGNFLNVTVISTVSIISTGSQNF